MDAMNKPITDLRNPMDLSGKSAIVTGGNRGIGFGISTAFSQRGAQVAILCRNIEGGRRAADELRADGGKAIAVQCDITDAESVTNAVKTVWEEFGRVDVLVNNAGVSSLPKSLIEFSDDIHEFTDIVDVNLFGTVRMSLACAKRMADAGGGCIINIASVGGFLSNSAAFNQPMSGYQVSKAALLHLTKVLAVELDPCNIRVNCVAPGPTHTDLDELLSEEMRKGMSTRTCTRRFGAGLEIGSMCAYLASNEAAQIDGSVIAVDGGILVKG
ncbi:MAG: glucose 1-dehydrogenase [Clostridiales bacterium]|nr:glucose 1-dehydrogenase [Clostridiales bacterium]